MKLIDTKNEASAFCLSVSLSIKYLRGTICGIVKKQEEQRKANRSDAEEEEEQDQHDSKEQRLTLMEEVSSHPFFFISVNQ